MNTPKSFALGQTEFSLSSRSIVSGISSEALNITQWTAPISSLLALTKWQTTIITSNNKSNEASFTKASRQQSLTALSTSHVAQTRTKEFINSVLSTDKLPEDLATKYLSLYRNSSIFSGKEHSFAISSIPSVVTPEITPTTFHVSGVIQPTSSRDKMHLSTFQKEDKSLISSQEAFTKSAFFDPQMRSKRNNLQTAQLSSSNTILVQIKGHDTAVHTNNGSKLFTKGSISSINLPRTFPLSSTIWKAAELKPSPDATSFLSPDKETYSHSTQTLDTEMTTAPMKGKFSGISGISKTTSQAKLTPEDKHLSSSFILTSWGITTTSVVISSSYGPHTAQEISSVTSFVTASPTVSSISERLSSTSTMTISTKPFVQLSVTSLISSHFSSKTETEFRALTKSYHEEINHGSSSISPSSSFLTSDVVLKHSDPVSCNKSFSDSLCESTSFKPKEAQSSSEVSTLTETSAPSLVGKQTARSLHSKTSEHTSSSMLQFPQEKFGSSIQVTLNVVSKISDSLKSSSMILEENLSSHYSSTVHSKAEWTVATNPEKNSALISSSSHQSVISGNTSAIGHGVRISRSFQSSVVSPKVVTPSSPIQSRTRIPHKNSSAIILSSNAERLTGFSLTAAPVVPSSSPVISRLRKQNSTFRGSYYKPIPSASVTGQQIRFSSSQSLVMSPELVSPSSSSMKSRLYIPHRNLSSIATSSYQKLIPSVSKNEQQVHLSSSQSTPLSTTGVLAPSSTSQSPSLVGAHKKNSSVTESYFKTVSSASLRRHPTHSSGFQNSVVSTEFVVPLYSPVMSRSKITHLRRSTFTSSSHNPPPSTSNIGHEIRLSSQSSVISEEQTAASSSLRSGSQILYDTPSRSAVTSSHQEPVASSKDRQSIHFSSQRSATVTSPITPSSSFLTSRFHILQERPSVSTGTYLSTEHQIPLPSSESSATSTKLVVPSSQSKRQSQTPYRRTSVTTGIYNKSLHSSSVTEQYVHLSSSRSPMTSMELVALSSHPKSSSQDPQKTSSARFQTPSASVSTTAATFIDKGKLQTSSSNIAVSPSRREFTSKINVSSLIDKLLAFVEFWFQNRVLQLDGCKYPASTRATLGTELSSDCRGYPNLRSGVFSPCKDERGKKERPPSPAVVVGREGMISG